MSPVIGQLLSGLGGPKRNWLQKRLSGNKTTFSTFLVSPLSWPIQQLWAGGNGKICPRPATFSLRFFKSARLLEARQSGVRQLPGVHVHVPVFGAAAQRRHGFARIE